MGNSLPIKPATGPQTQKTKYIIANRILDVLERYRLRQRDGTCDRNEEGRKRFLPIVVKRVEAKDPIHMVLPAFPFKSPNNISKVLGKIPDKGEEIALAHLNGICESIKSIYEPGAEIVIAPDGIVHNGKF
jgi:pyoverdine/dityrosine biosynthesis protein Dit1